MCAAARKLYVSRVLEGRHGIETVGGAAQTIFRWMCTRAGKGNFAVGQRLMERVRSKAAMGRLFSRFGVRFSLVFALPDGIFLYSSEHIIA